MKLKKSQYIRGAEALVAAGLPLPPLLSMAVSGDEVLPLALDARQTWLAWAEKNGYSAQQVRALKRVMGALVRSHYYLMALASDLSMRHDIDGEPVGPVGDEDRMRAALMLHVRALHDDRPVPKPEAKVVVPQRPILSLKKRA